MRVKEITPRMLILECRQEKGDKDYGSCLWARFMFNLDRYELSITSDCGNYGYKWCETPESESFLELMSRVSKDYLLGKLYGRPDVFDYELTKNSAYDWYGEEDEDREKLDEIFEEVELEYQPSQSDDFLSKFDDANNGYFADTFELPRYVYPSDALKIVDVFDTAIRPYIKKILSESRSEVK